MNALTKDLGNDIDKNAVEHYKIILRVCSEPVLDKHIFKISYNRPFTNYLFYIIYNRKFEYY